jgi:glyoxylase-like metal-dependent hydrolase (beta-lactamase superfamily II)
LGKMEISAYTDTRQIGRATITAISEGTALWAPLFQAPEAAWRAALPEADAHDRIPIGLTVLLVQIDGATILVDPGFDDPDDPSGFMSPKLEEPARSPGLAAALTALGLTPEDITHVAITHAHPDHCCGVAAMHDGRLVARFPNARHIIGRADWDSARAGRFAGTPTAERLGLLDRLGLLEPIDGEREIAPGIVMLPSPGETAGHMLVRVESAGARFYALGDLFHHACEVDQLDWVPDGRDPAVTRASRERLIAEAVPSGATLVYTHETFPPWGRIVATDGGYRWRRG